MLFQVVPSVLLSMVALITTYMKESDWLLKNFHQSESSLQSYHGEQNRGYHSKEHKKTILETGVKSDVAFCLESSIEKTNSRSLFEPSLMKNLSHFEALHVNISTMGTPSAVKTHTLNPK